MKKLLSIERPGAPSICNVIVNEKCKCKCKCHYLDIEETSNHYVNIEETSSKCNVNVFDGKKESLPSFKCIIVFVDCHHCRSNKIIIENYKTNPRIKFDQKASQESEAVPVESSQKSRNLSRSFANI